MTWYRIYYRGQPAMTVDTEAPSPETAVSKATGGETIELQRSYLDRHVGVYDVDGAEYHVREISPVDVGYCPKDTPNYVVFASEYPPESYWKNPEYLTG